MNHYPSPKLRFIPELDPEFRPISIENRDFLEVVTESGKAAPLFIGLERGDGRISVFETKIFPEGIGMEAPNRRYLERLVKSLLWIRGGFRVMIGGSKLGAEFVKQIYAPGELREFDAGFMSRIYEKTFQVDVCSMDEMPWANEETLEGGLHSRTRPERLSGCRIGFDAGGSDRKVAAVMDGKVIYSEEVVWHPKSESDPGYHYREILTALKTAAAHLPRVDAIGVSAAGVYVNNRVRVASLFRKVTDEDFRKQVTNLFLRIQQEMGGVPLEVANDGDVAALAGAMELGANRVLGIAMGTSQAGGYVNAQGNLTGWLNELAFAPVDLNPMAPVDEWSGDFGGGVSYFSQEAVIRLAPAAGITLAETLTPAEKLEVVQELHEKGDPKALKIFETIGIYLGYALPYYADFYDFEHALILGRVTSGKGGALILQKSREVLAAEFPELARKIEIHLPDESNRRVGQAVAAASLGS